MAMRLIIQRQSPRTQGWPVWIGMPGRFASEYAKYLTELPSGRVISTEGFPEKVKGGSYKFADEALKNAINSLVEQLRDTTNLNEEVGNK